MKYLPLNRVMALLLTWLFPSSRTFPDKVDFPVKKMFLLKDLGKTQIHCNEGEILPNVVQPVNAYSLDPGCLTRGSFGFGSNRLGSPMVINLQIFPFQRKGVISYYGARPCDCARSHFLTQTPGIVSTVRNFLIVCP